MAFRIGDKVIHCTFGLGEITQIEEKVINGHPANCYVVQMNDMTIWVPMDDPEQNSLRTPTLPDEFVKTLPILGSPNEDLLEDRVLRKKQLVDQLKDGQLASICRVVRDLRHYQRNSKLNDQEKSILDRAVKSLLTEWTFSLGTPQNQAYLAMENMLQS
ncbi:MAG TPA: CarD family transcriptional regulator [Anaerolineales bacterium]